MKRVVLVGGGHAHALVLLQFRDFVSKHLQVTLVTPDPAHVYSGMVPGVVAGHYAAAEAQIDLAQLCRDAGAEFVQGSVASMDVSERDIHLSNGSTLSYDLASLNPGSVPNYDAVPGAREHALAPKPFAPLLARWAELRGSRPRIAVVGAGAAGVELAMAMKFAGASKVVLFSDHLPFAGKLGERVLGALERSEIRFHKGTAVGAVEPGPTVISAAGRERFEAVVWTAGAAPAPLLRESGLQTDEAGFVQVDAALRSVSHPGVFAAGDCISFSPKSGVYAVRQGAVLARNLKRVLVGESPGEFRPQRNSLALISCGAKHAIASHGGWSAEGAWAWRWKDWIDRRWVERFR